MVATLACAGLHLFPGGVGPIESARNFYGVLSVWVADGDTPDARLTLRHGNTLHGGQLLDPLRRGEPTAYYGRASGVGRTLLWLQQADDDRAQHVGVIGLGTGTLAAHRRPGDAYRFYEIDPAVVDVARRRFSFLTGEQGAAEILLGDGRLTLEREPANGFRLLVIDAFSSDAIPMHLLTVEAMRVYRRHVDDDGALALHISNRYLDLRPVARRLADAIGWRALRVLDRPDPTARWLRSSDWVIVTGNDRLADALVAQGAEPAEADPGVAPWTDRYGNLFDVLKAPR